MNQRKTLAILSLILATAAIPAARAEMEWLPASLSLEVASGSAERLSGPTALALLETLPPAVQPNIGAGDYLAKLQKHFRSLVIAPKGSATPLLLECSSAKWAYVGSGRASQLKLVASNPQCSIRVVDDPALVETTVKSLTEIANEAQLANQISAPLELEKVCNTRLCDW